MARARNADKAAESAQEAREAQGSSSAFQADDRSGGLSAAQDMPQDTQGAGYAPDGAQESAEAVQDGEALRDPNEGLEDCQDKGVLQEGTLTEYAVTGCEALNLRELPDLSARVLAALPRGAGVLGSSSAFQADDRSGSLTTALGASFGCAEQPPRQPAAAQGPVDGWIFVRTGRLEGWMMSKYLEALPLPELAHAAE